MPQKLKIRAIGSFLGMIIPKRMLERLHVGENDELFAIETEEGILLTPHDPEFERPSKRSRSVVESTAIRLDS